MFVYVHVLGETGALKKMQNQKKGETTQHPTLQNLKCSQFVRQVLIRLRPLPLRRIQLLTVPLRGHQHPEVQRKPTSRKYPN